MPTDPQGGAAVPLTRERVAEIRATVQDLIESAERGPWPVNLATRETFDGVLRLCATVEAQAEVIERLRDGWDAATPWWQKDIDGVTVTSEPMPEAHQIALYGEVVAPREGNDG